jgi:pantoate--beta-alanine ligase
MEIVTISVEMQAMAERLRLQGKRIGVLPTMGYLHEGHKSLMKVTKEHADILITTIFVNPTQFGPNEDFERYPRDFERDRAMAADARTDILFTPTPSDMYPEGYLTYVETMEVSSILEGKFRPTHFRGVTTVVAKLFNITKPHVAVFGQKDAQQAFIMKKMVRDLNFGVEIIVAPIVREADGLAMSSRNVYLSPDQRNDATSLYRSLLHAETRIKSGERSVRQVKKEMEEIILSARATAIDYIAFLQPAAFREITIIEPEEVLIALAVRFGNTRLIDNRIIEVPKA